MKKYICLLLSVAVLALSFSGCKKEEAAFEINSDAVTILTYASSTDHNSFIGTFVTYVNYVYEDIDIEVININIENQAEYDMVLSQLKTEIMAGKGPDIYLLPTESWLTEDPLTGEVVIQEAFFSDINEAIGNKLFLPIDEFLSDSEYINMQNYPAAVIEAGKSEDGQVVMPLAYTCYLRLVDKNLMLDPEFTYHSIEELAASPDKNLVFSAYMDSMQSYRSCFSDIADYDVGKLTVDTDSLFETLKISKLGMNAQNKFTEMLIRHYVYDIPRNGSILNWNLGMTAMEAWAEYEDSVYPLYMPNDRDGITAYIPIFAAINSNSKHPEESFKVFELLFGDVVQQGKSYGNYNSTIKGNPINAMVIGGEGGAVSIDYNNLASEKQSRLLRNFAEKINYARFESKLEDCLVEIGEVEFSSGQEAKSAIEGIYTQMQMEMSE